MNAIDASGIVFVPILHGRLAFALAVREVFFRESPDCVAVEFPETMAAPIERAIRRLPLLSVLRYCDAGNDPAHLLIEPCDGLVEAVRLAIEHKIPWVPVDRDTDSYTPVVDRIPDPYAAERIGWQAYADIVAKRLAASEPREADAMREATMAYHVSRLSEKFRKVLFVCGVAHARRVRDHLDSEPARPLGRTRREGVEVLHLHRDSSREVLSEPGWIQAKFEGWRGAFSCGIPNAREVDRYRLMGEVLLAARDKMQTEDGEPIDVHSLRVASQFARNQALLRAGLAPDLYEIVTAARGAHSDDFAWHVWELLTDYPHQADPAALPTVRITLEELLRSARRVVFHRRLKPRRHRLRLVRTRKRAGDWEFDPSQVVTCSYPPEDIRIEGFASWVRNRSKGMLSSERVRVSPLTVSLCDGIDMRETIRNLVRDGRLYVKEHTPVRGNIDAVIVIFDEKDLRNRYRFTMTWQGEHDQESDMALYATPPEANVVGPHIGRCEYGGFLMTYPPGRLFQVFEDPYFDDAETQAERLLLAGIDYAVGRWIVYIAARPPRARLLYRARRSGKQVMYVPIGQLSPQTLRQLRVFHVLEGKHVRSYAGQYI